MKGVPEFFQARGKKLAPLLIAAAALGVLLMFLSNPSGGEKDARLPPEAVVPEAGAAGAAEAIFARERELERRLEEILALVADTGSVRVMLSFSPERETVYAADENTSESTAVELDAQGGSRETNAKTSQNKTILITDKAGTDRPLVLRELEPRVDGVIIIAEGGDSVFVKDALTKAACTVLGITANRVQVFKMKE